MRKPLEGKWGVSLKSIVKTKILGRRNLALNIFFVGNSSSSSLYSKGYLDLCIKIKGRRKK